MCKSILLQLISVISMVVGTALVIWHHTVNSCTRELWCGDPNPGDLGWSLLISGMVLQLLACLWCVP